MISRRHEELLGKRKLELETLVRLGVSSCEQRGDDWIAIPYYRDGQVVNHKYRTIAGEKRFSQDGGAPKIVYNFDCLQDETLCDLPLIITEGELDCIAALQAGFARCISVPDGAPSEAIKDRDSIKYKFLDSLPKSAREAKEIILAVDGDGPGAALLEDLSIRLGRARCKWVSYPKAHPSRGYDAPCKDLADALLRYGIEGVQRVVATAQWIALRGVYRMSELPPLVPAEPHDSGFPGLHEHYRLRLGDFCVLTGTPGAGKSTFLNDLAGRMATRHKWRACFASFEQVPQIDHRRALRTWFGACPVKDMDRDTLEKADKWIDENFVFIYPGDDEAPTLPWLLGRMSDAVIRYGCRLVMVDPWNELEHERPRDMTLTEYVGAALRELKVWARTHQVHLIVAAHPAKMRRGADGKYPDVGLYDISDSAHWANRADVGIVLHRDDGDDVRVCVAKSRYQDQIGTPGEAAVKYIWQRATYEIA